MCVNIYFDKAVAHIYKNPKTHKMTIQIKYVKF